MYCISAAVKQLIGGNGILLSKSMGQKQRVDPVHLGWLSIRSTTLKRVQN